MAIASHAVCAEGASQADILENARQALSLWAMINVAVAQQDTVQIDESHWGSLLDRLYPVLEEGPHFFENASICTVASACARLLLKPWIYLPILDKWLNPDWLVNKLDW